MNKIERLYKEWQALQPVKPELQRRMDQSFMIDFNYNSNHLEGNTLTYGQTKLLLLFGKVKGDALMRDCEEMKAHNVGLEMMKTEAMDKGRPLSENFIRELNRTILAGDFYKISHNGEYRYKIHTGVYKTRPNSVITPSGELFDYASPEETPSLMADLVAWYREEERKAVLSPVELAALFHYRYIRIHPFEDGNGRIARLLVNYILLRHAYPMIVILTSDRKNYLETLGKCDETTGREPYKGANATLEQIEPFVEYITYYVERKLQFAKELISGITLDISETEVKAENPSELGVRLGVKLGVNQTEIIKLIQSNKRITIAEMSKIIRITEYAVLNNLNKLKSLGIVERVGSDKTGYWRIR
ncbi:MAG: Fic family protein [Bacteroidales bacterium]|jgi:Fic family protein|nr:Fic family protein [Bacteroidales bacterium]